MKLNFMILFVALIVIFSCASTPESRKFFNKGVEMSEQKNYTGAIKYYEEALKFDPEYAEAAYNLGISNMKLNNNQNALIYFKRAVAIKSFYPNAWYNISAISFNQGNYKESARAALRCHLKECDELRELSYTKLAESGFINQSKARLKNETTLPFPEFLNNFKGEKKFSLYFEVSVKGKVENIKCEKSVEKEICDFYSSQVAALEFIPAYDFEKDELSDSDVTLTIRLDENKNVVKELVFRSAGFQRGSSSSVRAGGGSAVIMGAIDRTDIDAYIRRNLAKIQWCYEKELNNHPELIGKIVVNYIINPDGTVADSKVGRSTMGSEPVETCIAEHIKKIKFPKPSNGKVVIVNYPFVFKNYVEK